MLDEKPFLSILTGLFAISIMFTSSLFSTIASTKGFVQEASSQEGIADREPAEANTTNINSEQQPPEQQSLPATTLTSSECSPGTHAGIGTTTDAECIPDIPPEEEDFFFLDDKKIPVSIAVDQLGVVARDNVTSGELQQYLSGFQLELIREYPQNIFIFSLPGNFSRPEIVNLSRTIASEGEQLVAYAGFTATPEGAEAPFIVTDEFIAEFKPGIAHEKIASFNNDTMVQIVKPDPFVENQFLLKVTESSVLDALSVSKLYHESNLTVFAHPNFVRIIDFHQFIPNDPLFSNQWHHQNGGLGGGTVDADIDTPLAWDNTRGAPSTTIAIIDYGFDMTHRDLSPNFWVNAGEVSGNGVDDDGNGFMDDINGVDFIDNDGDPTPDAGDPILDNHGTAVAGIAAARGDNNLGVAGGCPNCSLMLIRLGSTVAQDADAFRYATQKGAQIISNSWNYPIGTPTPTVVVNAINDSATMGRGGLGSVIFFAMNNDNRNDCIGTAPAISSLNNVIAVSGSSNQDHKVTESAWGNCMDVLAPMGRGFGPAGLGGVPYTGTLNIATTDRAGSTGFNNVDPPNSMTGIFDPTYCPTETIDLNYTLCFGGTSAAAPLAAGVAGLILTANPGLTRLQVQQLLQDTADKIEDSVGKYVTNNGFSTGATGVSTHGHGRVNSFEAVHVATPIAQGGLGGVDIFLRDNRLDWGNTEQRSNTLFEPTRGFIGHWLSEDIKVDAPPYQPSPVTGTDFDRLIDETPSAAAGDINKVYVRVHNRGPITADSVTVKLHWAQFGTALPALPSDFWTAFPADSSDTSQWHPLNCAGSPSSTACTITNLAYSGSSIAATTADGAKIATFNFPASSVSPSLSNHFCLLAMIDSPQDHISPSSRSRFVVDDITPNDNNISHRNYMNLETSRDMNFTEGFFVRNPTDEPVQAVLRLEAPEGWKVTLDKFDFDKLVSLEPSEEVQISINVTLPELNQSGDVSIIQERIENQSSTVMGGLTYQFSTPPEIVEDCLTFNPQTTSTIQVNGVWTIADGSHLILDFPNKAEADQSLSIIKKYGFNSICFTGRPDPSIMYFLP